jgi:phosphatidylserine synthase 1
VGGDIYGGNSRYSSEEFVVYNVASLSYEWLLFSRNEGDVQDNIWAGICCVIFYFLIISVLAFPNGPFTRPHPAVWRIVFGMSVLYLLGLLFLLFQSYKTVNGILVWIDPSLKDFHIDMDKVCQDVRIESDFIHNSS